MEFRDKLIKLLDDRELSQADLARAMKTRDSTVQHWRDGRSRPGIKSLLKLARALRIDMAYLVDDALEEIPPEPDPQIEEIIRMVRDIGIEESRSRLLQVSRRPADPPRSVATLTSPYINSQGPDRKAAPKKGAG